MAANPVIRMAELKLESNHDLGEPTLRATGRITSTTAAALENSIRALIPGFRRIVLDLSNVDYIDSSGVGTLASLYQQARRANCDLEIDNPKPQIKDRLRAWAEKVFRGHEDMLGMTPD